MEEKPIALTTIATVANALAAHEAVIAAATAESDRFGLKASAEALHEALAQARDTYLVAREWSLDPDFVALSGGENKPPKDEPEEPGVGGEAEAPPEGDGD